MSSRWLAWISRRHELNLPENQRRSSSCWPPEALALYGAAQTTEDEREYLVADTKRILELDPDTDTSRNQVQRAFDTFRDEHDPGAVKSRRWNRRGV